MPFLVQLLLPRKSEGANLRSSFFEQVRSELTAEFGGVTVYSQAPAEGVWESNTEIVQDEIVLFEVMVPKVDAAWWRDYRSKLESRLKQEEIVVRAHEISRL